jgi:hypothetical protein
MPRVINETELEGMDAAVVVYLKIVKNTFVSKRDLQWYSKCYYVTSVAKMFTLKGVQSIDLSKY